MFYLALDTSSQSLSLALMQGEDLLAELTTNTQIKHSRQLLPLLASLMEQLDYKYEDLEAVVVSRGPGSYTGLRIGATVAKMLAWTLRIPLYSVDSLALLASSLGPVPGLVLSVFDARRGNVFGGAFRWQGEQLQAVRESQHAPLDVWLPEVIQSLPAELPITLLAPDLSRLRTYMDAVMLAEIRGRLVGQETVLRAPEMAALPWQREDEMTFKPAYLKLAEAEERWLGEHPEADLGANYVERME